MNHILKYIYWGAAIMFVVSAIGLILGPSPLNLIFAPILGITFPLLKIISTPFTTIQEILSGGVYGSSHGFFTVFILLTGWNTLLGALGGWIVGTIVRWKK